MINFLINPIAKYVAAALAAVLVFGGMYAKGRIDGKSLTEAKYTNAKLEWQQEVAKRQRALEQELAELRLRYERDTARYRQQLADLKAKPEIITRYIPSDTQCSIPKGFVDLHNRAIQGVPLDPPPADAANPSTKTLPNVGTIVTENYIQYNIISKRLEALQDLVKQYQQKQKDLVK